MKASISRMIAPLLIVGLLFASSATAGPPVPGLLVSASDMAFIETHSSNVRTPLANDTPVGLFSAVEADALSAPYVRELAGAAVHEPKTMKGLMITGADLRFITGPDDSGGFLHDEWAVGPLPVGAGR